VSALFTHVKLALERAAEDTGVAPEITVVYGDAAGAEGSDRLAVAPSHPGASPIDVEVHRESGTTVVSFGVDSRIEFLSTDEACATLALIERSARAIFKGTLVEVVEEDAGLEPD